MQPNTRFCEQLHEFELNCQAMKTDYRSEEQKQADSDFLAQLMKVEAPKKMA